MNNPLYPNSNSTGVMAAYEQASFMEDTKQTIEKNHKLDTLEFKPTKSVARTQNLDRLELKGKKQQVKKKSNALETGAAILGIALTIANPAAGLGYALGVFPLLEGLANRKR